MQISSEAMKKILAAVKDGSASMLEASGAPPKGLNLKPGTEVTGELLAKLPNGRSLVRVNGEILDMPLSKDTQVGSSLKMTFVGNQPRPTFAVPSQTLKMADINISNASRWLGTLTSATLDPAEVESPLNTRAARLFDSFPADSGTIAARLKETVSRSGVFYESHLERWANGNYPLEEILKEPQGQRSAVTRQQSNALPGQDSPSQSLFPDATDSSVSVKPQTATPDRPGASTRSSAAPTPSGKTMEIALPATEATTFSDQTAKSSGNSPPAESDLDTVMRKETMTSDGGVPQERSKPSVAPQTARAIISDSAVNTDKTAGFTSTSEHGLEKTPQTVNSRESGTLLTERTRETTSGSTPPVQAKTGQAATDLSPAGTSSETDHPATAREPQAKGSPSAATGDDPPGNHPVTVKVAVTGSGEETSIRAAARLFQQTLPTGMRTALPSLPSAQQTFPTATTIIESGAGADTSSTPVADQPAVKAELQKQALNLQEPNDFQTRLNRQHSDKPSARTLPLVAPETSRPDPLLNQTREPAGLTAKPDSLQFEPPDSKTLPVVRQQLEILNSGQFVWQGEAWRGQHLEWTIRKDEKRRQSSNARSWDTDVSLKLPKLGAVTASISITGNQARISITAAEPETAASMEKQSSRLIQGLESGGLILASLEVEHGQTSR